VEKAFANLRRLLKPGGLLVFTVPFAMQGDTVEHFPDLHQYSIENRGGTYVLVNTTADGRCEEHANLVFHGGPGSTLELRLFSESSLRRNLEGAGFGRIAFHREPCFKWGIYWKAPWSVPITAIAA
jgi:SAM-dependent methyltransferase